MHEHRLGRLEREHRLQAGRQAPAPARRLPDLPKPGWTGEYEWDGYVPYEELPEIVDPPGGAIVTANNRIAPDDYPHHITSEYLDGYRAARIEQLLAERERHTLDDFERIQMDVSRSPAARPPTAWRG